MKKSSWLIPFVFGATSCFACGGVEPDPANGEHAWYDPGSSGANGLNPGSWLRSGHDDLFGVEDPDNPDPPSPPPPPETGDLCDSCVSNEDCGGPKDLCLMNTQTNQKICARYCGGGASCPENYVCADISGGESTQQCVPASGKCEGYEPPPPPPPPGTCGNTFETDVFNLVNKVRAQNSLKAYDCDSIASQVAHQYSQYMCDAQFFSHQAPDGSLPWDRLKAAGATFSAAGENIAAGQPTPQQVMDSWMNSPGHKANILQTMFTHIGVGYITCNDMMVHYWTQNFLGK
ncbi:MAG: CAP domain-containing protein [Pseudomonadota bacterium]